MTDQEKERAFLQALAADRCDQATRKIYADWLSERGQDDKANEQLRMATEEWCTSARWMENYAKNSGSHCTNYEENYQELRRETESLSWSNPGHRQQLEEIYEKYRALENWVPITFEILIQAGHDWINHQDWFTQKGQEGLRGHFVQEFWDHWQVITGEFVEERHQENCFSCSC